MAGPWKVLYGSVAGTSHERRGEPCQDCALTRVCRSDGGPILVAACADGAGSARHADLGAKLACLGIVRTAAAALEGGLPLEEVDRRRMLRWYEEVRGQLSLEACLRNLPSREFACTLLTAVVGERRAVFSQIGDGAVVLHQGAGSRTAFWPQSGEYASTTFFLTGEDYEERLMVLALEGPVEELALLTDGLQPLALHYASRSVHAPFFEPMFRALRNVPAVEDLEGPLRDFLSSGPVNDRTDDDKTLVLATRRTPDDERLCPV
jgi:hypothetical protein